MTQQATENGITHVANTSLRSTHEILLSVQGSADMIKGYTALETDAARAPHCQDSLALSDTSSSNSAPSLQAVTAIRPLRSRRDSYKNALRLLYKCNGSFTSFKLHLQLGKGAIESYIQSSFSVSPGGDVSHCLEISETASSGASADLPLHKVQVDNGRVNRQSGAEDRQSTLAYFFDHLRPIRMFSLMLDIGYRIDLSCRRYFPHPDVSESLAHLI